MNLQLRKAVCVAAVGLAVAGCSGTKSPAATGSVGSDSHAIISDQFHSGGSKGFVWLAPMVPAPKNAGDLVEKLPVTVRIDETNVDGSTKRSLATFTAKTGPEGEHIRFYADQKLDGDDNDNDADDQGYYLARWDTDDAKLSVAASYRVHVYVPAKGAAGAQKELGFADVAVVRDAKTFKGVDTNNFTPLINGKVLRIKFRVGTAAVDADGDGVYDWLDNCPATANADQKDTVGNGIGDACRCDKVTCTAQDGCHAVGVCQKTSGTCTNPALSDGTACTISGATASCTAGVCTLLVCNAGTADCDKSAANGCETNITTTANCGACGIVCPAATNASAACTHGACALVCATGWLDCDGKSANGCEQNIATDENNCGACGTVCAAHESCIAGVCSTATCKSGFADCNKAAVDGCEVTLASDANNCGHCGVVCSLPNSTAKCAASACAIDTCNPGFADGNGNPSDGCEVNLNTDISNCGGLGHACGAANATPACTSGVCTIANCTAGFADCNGTVSDGCEINLNTDANNCGACSNILSLPNATAACVGGKPTVDKCATGFADCDGQAGTGCEVDTTSDTGNCGKCGTTCASGANSTATCTASKCGIACAAGYSDCNADPTDGCEVNTAADNSNCGTCATVCGNHETCQSGACSTAVCDVGFAHCDPNANGCEVTLATDASNCGGCGSACTFPNAVPQCANSTCAWSVCNTNYADCNQVASDGCEINVATNTSNCGGCGAYCTGAGMQTVSCVAGQCTGTCLAGSADCDGNLRSNGCETYVGGDDNNNCGACGNVCPLGQLCFSGVCSSCMPKPAGIVSYWTGDVNGWDSGPGANHLGEFPGVSHSPGYVGNGFWFDGNGEAYSGSNLLPTGNQFRTVEFWANVTGTPGGESFMFGYGTIGSVGSVFALGLFDGGLNPYFSQWGAAEAGPSVTLGSWHHYAAVLDSSFGGFPYCTGGWVGLYVDGYQVAYTDFCMDTTAGTNVQLGHDYGDPYRALQGGLDEVTVYNRALGWNEIYEIHRAGTLGKCR